MRKFSGHIPLLSSVMENQPTSLSIVGSLAVHFTLASLDLPSWRCPLRYGLNIPCPGCGLSRAILLLGKGNWQQALKIHAFAPIALMAITLIIIAVILPPKYNQVFIQKCKNIEKNTGITTLLLAAFVTYWLIRLLIFPKNLYQLVM